MARINSNIPALIARANLERSNADLNTRLERLATGLRINRGKDDPAGLIISERIRSEIEGVNQGIKNADRASAVIATTESSLSEVNSLLNSIRSLMVEASNTGANSAEEREANQLAIDSAIDSITRISNTASFGGLRLLDGSLDYVLSGVSKNAIEKAQVSNASFFESQAIGVEVDVLASAQKGQLFLPGVQPGATNGTIMSSMSLRIAGNVGVQEITFTSGTTLDRVVAAVNQVAGFTGVRAHLLAADGADTSSGMVFESADYGSKSFVSVERLNAPADTADDQFRLFKFQSGTPFPSSASDFPWGAITTGAGSTATLTDGNRDEGQDVSALVNGNLANGDGLEINVNSTALGMKLILDESFATTPSGSTSTFYITGGGSTFQLGPQISPLQQTNIGVQSVAASKLGGTLIDGSLDFLSSLKDGQGNSIRDSLARGDFVPAQEILNSAIDEISVLRGRLGAFERNTLETNVRSLQSSFENLSASDSKIRDADFAAETSQLTRAQILTSAGTSVLTLANQQSSQVLQLLG